MDTRTTRSAAGRVKKRCRSTPTPAWRPKLCGSDTPAYSVRGEDAHHDFQTTVFHQNGGGAVAAGMMRDLTATSLGVLPLGFPSGPGPIRTGSASLTAACELLA
jgi:hypothetical protein